MILGGLGLKNTCGVYLVSYWDNLLREYLSRKGESKNQNLINLKLYFLDHRKKRLQRILRKRKNTGRYGFMEAKERKNYQESYFSQWS